MRIFRYSPVALALLVVGCSQTQPVAEQSAPPGTASVNNPPPGGGAGIRDVTIQGVSILGTWYAVEVLEDAGATHDLELGTMEMTLLVQPNGRSTLTGVDRREGDGRVSFNGIIEGTRISFDGMDGNGTLSMSGRRLILRDPRGRSTVYVQGE